MVSREGPKCKNLIVLLLLLLNVVRRWVHQRTDEQKFVC